MGFPPPIILWSQRCVLILQKNHPLYTTVGHAGFRQSWRQIFSLPGCHLMIPVHRSVSVTQRSRHKHRSSTAPSRFLAWILSAWCPQAGRLRLPPHSRSLLGNIKGCLGSAWIIEMTTKTLRSDDCHEKALVRAPLKQKRRAYKRMPKCIVNICEYCE